MKAIFFLILIFSGFFSFCQNYIDTTFRINGYSCSCKYLIADSGENKLYTITDKKPSFPGGNSSWKKFLKQNLINGYSRNEGEFLIQFVVNQNGNISDIKRLTYINDEKFEEVKRLLFASGKWFPAIQNGKCVKAYHQIKFRF